VIINKIENKSKESTLKSLKAEELVLLAEMFNKGSNQNNAMIKKIFDNIEKE
jgi:hypothetical protein